MDAEALEELFAPVGSVELKRMFGGFGVYLDGLIVAVKLSTGEVMLKGDAVVAPAYEAAGGRRWTYEREGGGGPGRATAMPYWSMPDVCFDDEDELRRFTLLALEASRRAEAAKKPATTGDRRARPSGKAKPKS